MCLFISILIQLDPLCPYITISYKIFAFSFLLDYIGFLSGDAFDVYCNDEEFLLSDEDIVLFSYSYQFHIIFDDLLAVLSIHVMTLMNMSYIISSN